MTAPSARRPLFRWAALAVVAAAGLGAWYGLSGGRSVDSPPAAPAGPGSEPPPPDPRLTFDTPFRNVRPDVQYVGDAVCAGCHTEIDKSYHAHPMGRSAAVGATHPVERFDEAAHNPFRVGPYELSVERAGGVVRHHVRAKGPDGKPLPEYVATADLALGSGTRGRSYLTFDGGAAWQTPISWYGPEARWDLSPGFDLGNGGRRAVGPECLFCHVNRVEPVPGSVNRYRGPFPVGQPAIGCERCHGPGGLHAAERAAGPPSAPVDTSIVNPAHLSADLRSAVCAQCHLQGEQRVTRRGRDLAEYRPGLPLDLFVTVHVRHPDLADLHKSVGQFEQMYVSRCFTASRGRFGCVSCHDPHAAAPAAPADRAQYYRARCLTCHAEPGHECAERAEVRQAAADNCVQCHMPREQLQHRPHQCDGPPGGAPAVPPTDVRRHLPDGATPVVPFPLGGGVPPAEAERDLGVALGRLGGQATAAGRATPAWLTAQAVERLTAAVGRWPDDVPAWLALGQAYQAGGDQAGTLRAAQAAVERAPGSAEGWALAAGAATAAGEYATALAAASEWVRLSPSGLDPLLLRADVRLLSRGDVAAAEADCWSALALHPLHPGAHLLLAICRTRQGDAAGGWREAEVAAGLAASPRQRTAIRDRFRAEARGGGRGD